ncbi:MAG: hypothetical protein ACYTFO_01055 [Planctomycetota bacterium]|jgi:hypothetical protein
MTTRRQKVTRELKAVGLTSLYFGSWIFLLAVLKQLVLAEYNIEVHGLSIALVGAALLAKVVLVLEHAPLHRWLKGRPAWMDVVVRTALYALGVLVILLLEKAVRGSHEHGGLWPSLVSVFRHADVHHVWAMAICLSSALLGYNVLFVVRRRLGRGGLFRLFLSPLSEEGEEA